MRRNRSFMSRLASVLILASLLSSAAAAQERPGSAASTQPECSGAWTGNVTYTSTHDLSSNKTVGRVSFRGRETQNIEVHNSYSASVAVLEEPGNPGSSIGKASIQYTATHSEKKLSEERNSCDQGKTWRVMTKNFEHRSETRGNASHQEATVGVGVNEDGTYSVTVSLPSIQGLSSGSNSASYSGQCVPKGSYTMNIPPTPASIEGNSAESSGNDRVDPTNPNSVSGSYSSTHSGNTETITWNLQKCGAPLRITALQFEEMKFPNWGDWRQIPGEKGTIDGNFVKTKVKILNASGESKSADVRFPYDPLAGEVQSVQIEPNSEETVELVWDSSGYAWFDGGSPRYVQRITAKLEEDGKKIDEKTEYLKISPKPVVLVHGLWSNWHAWENWQDILTKTYAPDWKAFPVGEKKEKGLMNTGNEFLSTEPTATIAENALQLQSYVRYAQEDRNAWHIDIVAHSMGGLISRYYINNRMEKYTEDPRPRVSHLIMLGTPNMGSPCADLMDLGFAMVGKEVEAIRQLRTSYLEDFNKVIILRNGVKFSALAGNPLPAMCRKIVFNDGVVSVPSAKWKIKDTAESSSLHTDLTSTSDFSSFVKPRLAIGPKGNHAPELPDILDRPSGQNDWQKKGVRFLKVGFQNQPAIPDPQSEIDSQPDFAKSARLSPKQSVEIEIPVGQANNFGTTFMADSQISATLFNEKGEIVGKNLAKTPEAGGWFRSIFHDKPTTKATWKLRLENSSDKELDAIVVTWSNAAR